MNSSLPDGRQRRMLVIDHDEHAMAWLRDICHPDFSFRVVASLAMASDAVASFRPDAIVIATSMFDNLHPDVAAARAPIEHVIAGLRGSSRSLPVLVRCSGDSHSTMIAIAVGGLEGVDVFSIDGGEDALRQKLTTIERQRQRQRQPRMQVESDAVDIGHRLPLLGTCPAMLRVFNEIGTLSRMRTPVLITGEVGTGKRSVARSIHHAGEETHKPFRVIDAAATESDVMEAFLFNPDEPGSITTNHRLSGTIVIAHAEYLAVRLQAMFASLVDSPSIQQRIILTSDNAASLWPDLRYALQRHCIALPPLRSRGADIELLVDHFADTIIGASPDQRSVHSTVTPAAMSLLRQHRWPGNLSELRSVISSELRGGKLLLEDTETLRQNLGYADNVISYTQNTSESRSLADSHLDVLVPSSSALPSNSVPPSENHTRLTCQLRSEDFWRLEVAGYAASLPPAPEMGMLLGEATESVEAGLIAAALENTRGNIAQSARLLGITRVSLRRKIQALQLSIPGRPLHPQ